MVIVYNYFHGESVVQAEAGKVGTSKLNTNQFQGVLGRLNSTGERLQKVQGQMGSQLLNNGLINEEKELEDHISKWKVTKEKVTKVLAWIRLPGLNIKYWGKGTLTKIAGLVGKPLKADRATKNKERMTYARILVELPLDKIYPIGIMFKNEQRRIVEQLVEYE
ncbi:hypothetical protein FXO38_04672 [Capsicum annuum]|nr:hypothetical protein FXO37_14338 [Capsicum annuum]KAF3675665.1 hypothetical protein FXO38_04672 [Capsicum annuum]